MSGLTDGFMEKMEINWKKNIGLAVTAGISEKNYSKYGDYKYTLKEVLVPFEITINYCQGNYKNFVAFYIAEFESIEERIEKINLFSLY